MLIPEHNIEVNDDTAILGVACILLSIVFVIITCIVEFNRKKNDNP